MKSVIPGWQKEEWKRVFTRRLRAFGPRQAAIANESKDEDDGSPAAKEPEDLVGLSVSGGGIRSALYNDGFLQGLSHRGFLRYVDYISSVSGGGYIAGHLTSQAKKPDGKDAEPCFHDDPERRQLGRDATTGQVDETRLSGIGGYLSRPLEFLPAYLWSFFFSFAFYIGAVGILATIAALFWRSFDDPVFRQLYLESLGLTTGNELTVAFIPAIVVFLLSVFCEAIFSLARFAVGMERELPRRIHLSTRKVYLFLIVFSLLASIAIFLGNGITNVRNNASGFVRLNYFTHYFAIAAAAIQIVVFLGRDRLFRSERGESKQWQKYVQQTVTTVTLLFLTFSMVHWMGREDISEYTTNRDPHLVQGDVSDWYLMDQLFDSFEAIDGNPEPAETIGERAAQFLGIPSSEVLDPSDQVPEKIKPRSNWIAFLAVKRLKITGVDSLTGDRDKIRPPSPLAKQDIDELAQIWALPDRIYGAYIAYTLAMSEAAIAEARNGANDTANRKNPSFAAQIVSRFRSTFQTDAQALAKQSAHSSLGPDQDQESVPEQMRVVFNKTIQTHDMQVKKMKAWNNYLQRPEFTGFLLDGITPPTAAAPTKLSANGLPLTLGLRIFVGLLVDPLIPFHQAKYFPTDVRARFSTPTPQGYISLSDRVSDLLKSTDVELTDFQRESLLSAVRRLRLIEQSAASEELPSEELPSEQLKTATANRLLIEGLFPGAVRLIDEPSTHVVPPHDQQARRQWLCFWMLLMLVGMIGGFGQSRVATVFQFYRQQLAENFLVASCGEHEKSSDKELYELDPTSDGLPYPLMLAATLEPSTHNGSYRVDAQPFVFSPLYCGRFDEDHTPIPSRQLSFSRNPAKPAVNLGDAITLSGAAVTPLMTGNRWLSMILDFFNTGIGQRLQRVDRTGATFVRESRILLSLAFIACVGTYTVATSVIHLNRPWACVGVVVTAMLSYCLIKRIGSPGMIRSLLLPQAGSSYDVLRKSKRQSVQRQAAAEKRNRNRQSSFYVADGGYSDYLGVTELLRRRCDLIVVSDAGANIGNNPLGTLAQMCEKAAREMGIKFLDLDHEAPIEFGRLEISDQRLVHQPYLCMRIRYPGPESKESHLFYCQMSITDTDPIEIQNIRNLFPSFPDEPTVNQFYSEKQVTAYRMLGYHIANRLCNELERWQIRDDQHHDANRIAQGGVAETEKQAAHEHPANKSDRTTDPPQPIAASRTSETETTYKQSLIEGRRRALFDESLRLERQPLFTVLQERLLTAYRLACYEEHTYRKDDIFTEAIWPAESFAFPSFRDSVTQTICAVRLDGQLPDRWLRVYELSADVRSAYRTAVVRDINELSLGTDCLCAGLWSAIVSIACQDMVDVNKDLLAAHLATIGTACQEVHRGRPHATFQIGGRKKLIHLCRSVAEPICASLNHQTRARTDENLYADMDGVIAELIELERSVFQGGEHVATISFAQCMSTMWGRIARLTERDPDEVVSGLRDAFLGEATTDTSASQVRARKSPEIRIAELRRWLHVGLRRTKLSMVRESLIKSWYLGYFSPDELSTFLATAEPPSSEKKPSRKSVKKAPVPEQKKR